MCILHFHTYACPQHNCSVRATTRFSVSVMCYVYVWCCGAGNKLRDPWKKLDFISSRNFGLCFMICFWVQTKQRTNTNLNTHAHINLYNVVAFPLKGEGGCLQNFDKRLVPPTLRVSHPVFCFKPSPKPKTADRRWYCPICGEKDAVLFFFLRCQCCQFGTFVRFHFSQIQFLIEAKLISKAQRMISCSVIILFSHVYTSFSHVRVSPT